MTRIPGASAVKRARAYISAYGASAFARELWSRASRSVSGSELPNRFHVEISNTCNFDCEYCVLREQATGDKVMSEATFEAILPYLHNASSVALSGLAEPLMNRRFPQILTRVREVAPHALISIDTNASLLTEDLAGVMVDQRLGSLVFSLDGADAELVDGIRKGGSLDALIGKIEMLNRVKRERGSKLPSLAATMVLQRKNAEQLPAVVELASTLGVSVVTVNGLEPYEAGLAHEALWSGDAAPEAAVADAMIAAERIANDRGIDLRFPARRPDAGRCPQMGRPLIMADGTVVPCSVLAYHRDGFLAIDADGDVVEERTETERLSFGNVNDRSLAEIWTDPAYRDFRDAVARGEFPPACEGCLMKHNVICPNEPVSAEEFLSAR